MPWLAYSAMNLLDWISRTRARRWGVDYQYMFLQSNGKDLALIADSATDGSLRPVVGDRTDLKDIERFREVAEVVYTGKGGLGKTVIDVQ